MAHIFFERLEKRHSTQSLFPYNNIFNLDQMEKWVGNSVLNQTQGFQRPNFWSSSPYYSSYQSYNFSPSSSFFGSSFLPQMTSWPSQTNSWSPWTYAQSSWTSPMSFGANTWSNPIYPWNSFLKPLTYPSSGMMVSAPSGTTISYPSGTTTQYPYPPGTRYGLIKRSHLKV